MVKGSLFTKISLELFLYLNYSISKDQSNFWRSWWGFFMIEVGLLPSIFLKIAGLFTFRRLPLFIFLVVLFLISVYFSQWAFKIFGALFDQHDFYQSRFWRCGVGFFTIRRNFLIGFPFLFFRLLTFSSSPIKIWLFDHSGGDFLDEDQGDFFNTRALLDQTLKFLFFANLF